MNNLFSKIAGLMLVLAIAFAVPSYADESEVVALKAKIDKLNEKLSAVESKLDRVESMASKKATPAYKAPATASTGSGFFSDLETGGYLDVQWNNNFRQPTTVAGTNAGRIFDTDDGSFTVNAFEWHVEKPVSEPGDAGFRVDLTFGEDSVVVAADDSADTADEVGLQQAYIQYIAPIPFFEGSEVFPDQVTIQAGRFVTLAGLEVIEGPDNWNISRSFGFGFGLPFVHTGVRTNFGLFNDYFDVYLGVNNGWDNPVDNNGEKTLEAAVGYEPLENVSVFHAWYLGNNNSEGTAGAPATATGAGNRFLWTNVITYDFNEKLSFMFDFDWGMEGNTDAFPAQTNSAWYEFAWYARYQVNEKFALAYRAEIFRDDTVFRTGLADSLFGQTFTAEYKLNDNLIARGELRVDNADDDVIQGVSHSSQTTVGAQLLYLI